jgi:hypothetical protein
MALTQIDIQNRINKLIIIISSKINFSRDKIVCLMKIIIMKKLRKNKLNKNTKHQLNSNNKQGKYKIL